MVFEDIVGQQNVIKNIKNSVENNRTAHAYLFCGPDGVGKSIAASVFAAALNCREKGPNPCGRCPSCIRARDKNHPDIIHLKAKGQSISIDEVREMQKNIQKRPYEEGIKVFIIHDSDKMKEEAQNALLKTLEEPPRHAVIILLTQNQYALLDTIKSRCQVLKFMRAPERSIENYLKSQKGANEREARFIAALSDGIVGKAIELLDNGDAKRERDSIIEIAGGIFGRDKAFALSQTDYFMGNKDRIDYILGIMMVLFRDMLVYKECSDAKYIINLDKEDTIAREVIKYTDRNLYNIINSIKKTAESIKSNGNYQLSIETMLLNIQEG